MSVLGIIPARYDSTRFPGKPLVDIAGKSMIQRVYEQCKKSNRLDDVVVATDDDRIMKEVTRFGGKCILTSSDHTSGTDRCAEVISKLENKFDFVVNIQGDEPFISPDQIDSLVSILNNETQIGTLVKKITDTSELNDVNKPKVILNKENQAIYFSRHPIPFYKNVPVESYLDHHTYYKHIGIYGYQREVLFAITKLPQSSLEMAESLEQLRWIENGYTINAKETTIETFGIDTPSDLEKARLYIDNR